MDGLANHFEAFSRSGVYRTAAAQDFGRAGQAAGLRLCAVRLPMPADKAALLRAVSEALAFPPWFGHNWDALEDCLTDLSWCPAEGYLLLLEGHEGLPGEVVRTFVEVLASAAQYWAARHRRFFAVFVDPQRTLELPEATP